MSKNAMLLHVMKPFGRFKFQNSGFSAISLEYDGRVCGESTSSNGKHICSTICQGFRYFAYRFWQFFDGAWGYNLVTSSNSIAALKLFGVTETELIWLQANAVINLLAALILLGLGIGLLAKKPGARLGAIIFGFVAIALNIFSAVLLIALFPDGLFGLLTGTQVMVSAIAGVILQSIYPLLTIIFMSRPAVKAALNRRA